MIIEKVIGNVEAVIARGMWLVQQCHPRLVRRPPAFVPVAGNAGADYVVPGMFSTPPAWNNVVQGKLLGLASAVLTGVLVTGKYLGPAQFFLVAGTLDHIDESNY